MFPLVKTRGRTHHFLHFAKVRMYAQVGLDREQGFFVIGSDTPVYRDQRRSHLLKISKMYIYLSEKQKMTKNRVASCIGTRFFGIFVGSFWIFLIQTHLPGQMADKMA